MTAFQRVIQSESRFPVFPNRKSSSALLLSKCTFKSLYDVIYGDVVGVVPLYDREALCTKVNELAVKYGQMPKEEPLLCQHRHLFFRHGNFHSIRIFTDKGISYDFHKSERGYTCHQR